LLSLLLLSLLFGTTPGGSKDGGGGEKVLVGSPLACSWLLLAIAGVPALLFDRLEGLPMMMTMTQNVAAEAYLIVRRDDALCLFPTNAMARTTDRAF
jgi:hypothetical protein